MNDSAVIAFAIVLITVSIIVMIWASVAEYRDKKEIIKQVRERKRIDHSLWFSKYIEPLKKTNDKLYERLNRKDK